MSEFDATSRVPNERYRENWDRIFGKAKAEREERSEGRQTGSEPEVLAESLRAGSR